MRGEKKHGRETFHNMRKISLPTPHVSFSPPKNQILPLKTSVLIYSSFPI
jgi:hypothetical protein